MVKVTERAKWTPDDDRQLAALLSEGKTYPQIARKIGRSPAGITHRVRRLGIAPNSAPCLWSKEEDAILRDMCLRRCSNKEIADRVERSQGAVRTRRLRLGFDNEKAKWSPDRPVDREHGDPFAGVKFEDAPVKKLPAVLSIPVSMPLRNNYMADM